MLTIGLPQGKSLESSLRALLAAAGITLVENGTTHTVRFPDYPALQEGIFLKPNRVPLLVAKGICDVGITGEDTVHEGGVPNEVEILRTLPFGRASEGATRIVLFASQDDPVNRIEDVPEGSTILSEYPNVTRAYFRGKHKDVVVEATSGACEAEIPRCYRFGVALSETGNSLRKNKLKPIATLLSSSTVLVGNKEALADPKKRAAVETLQDILCGVLSAKGKVYLSMNVPAASLQKVVLILPSIGSPTIAPLQNGGSSVSVVATQAQMNALIAPLKRLNVTGIIATPLTTVIP